jgi:hypothetical protein
VVRHVARLSTAPVVVDRPGGVVRSERELRIVVPVALRWGKQAQTKGAQVETCATGGRRLLWVFV